MAKSTEETELPIMPADEPLIAALPPVMDYVTYMVLLETQLVPEKLSILNKLLIEDDGTLVQEIGWDLLRLVLPMLQQNPQEATKCLECIARRGNPREVIVKVAEELERLEENSDHSVKNEDSESGLPTESYPTFAGEAERIHLGTMTLDGMPPSLSRKKKIDDEDIEPADDPKQSVGADAAVISLQFQSLMSVLSMLHLRIKTQYPSRFLATSLPAALSAYRRIGVNVTTTYAFLSLLEKLSGKQPQLPPRNTHITTDSANSTAQMMQSNLGSIAISLPDSEAENGSTIMQQASENEKTIVLRLLQAVLLEALDDYMSSLQAQDHPYIAWTERLRERTEPKRLVPGRKTETQKWQDDAMLSERDDVLKKFLGLSEDLGIDVYSNFQEIALKDMAATSNGSEEAESPTEYPTKPSQIPFPPSGILFLYAAQQFASISPQSKSPQDGKDPNLPALARIYRFFHSPENTSYFYASFATEDALLSLLYLIKDRPRPVPKEPEEDGFDFKNFFLALATFCAEFPEPTLRDAAHGVATALFHGCGDAAMKIQLVKEILGHSTSPAALMAVVLGWVKDELLQREVGLQAKDLTSDAEMAGLLFPVPVLSGEADGLVEEIAQLPYYIASLNLLCVVRGNSGLTGGFQGWDLQMERMVAGITGWKGEVRWLEGEIEEGTEVGGMLRGARADLWALDDALGRVEG